jgi:hypothetical protein
VKELSAIADMALNMRRIMPKEKRRRWRGVISQNKPKRSEVKVQFPDLVEE